MPCLPIAVIQCPLPVRTYFRNYPPGEGHGRGGASLSRRAALPCACAVAHGPRRRARGLPGVGGDPVRPGRGRRPEPRPRAARACRRLRGRLVRRAVRTPRDLRDDQQSAVVRPDERVSMVPFELRPEGPAVPRSGPRRERHGCRARARGDPRKGPLSSRDFEREAGPTKDWFGMPENAVRAVLEAYTVVGVVGLARRDGNIRYYDLLERLLPAEVLGHEVSRRDPLRHKP